ACAVVSHTSENHAGRVRPHVLCDRAEHDIDTGSVTIDLRPIAQSASIAGAVALDEQMPIARCDVRMARQNVLAVLRLADRHRRALIHALREWTTERRGYVLRDHDRGSISRQCTQDFADRLRAAG